MMSQSLMTLTRLEDEVAPRNSAPHENYEIFHLYILNALFLTHLLIDYINQ